MFQPRLQKRPKVVDVTGRFDAKSERTLQAATDSRTLGLEPLNQRRSRKLIEGHRRSKIL